MKPKPKFVKEKGFMPIDGNTRIHIPVWFIPGGSGRGKYFYIPVSQKFIESLSRGWGKSTSTETRDDYFRTPPIIIDPENCTVELPGGQIDSWKDNSGTWNYKTGRKKRIKKEK